MIAETANLATANYVVKRAKRGPQRCPGRQTSNGSKCNPFFIKSGGNKPEALAV